MAGLVFHNRNLQRFRNEKGQELTAIADLKVRQIVTWRRERIGDADYIAWSRRMADLVKLTSERKADTVDLQEYHDWVTTLFLKTQYSQMKVVGLNSQLLISAPDTGIGLSKREQALMTQAWKSNHVIMSDLELDSNYVVSFKLAIPIREVNPTDTTVIGGAILQIDPYAAFYPMVQTWPIPRKTAEFILVRREGNDVLFLNSLRHKQIKPLAFRLSTTESELPASHAVTGKEGVIEGTDYRNIRVLAATQKSSRNILVSCS